MPENQNTDIKPHSSFIKFIENRRVYVKPEKIQKYFLGQENCYAVFSGIPKGFSITSKMQNIFVETPRFTAIFYSFNSPLSAYPRTKVRGFNSASPNRRVKVINIPTHQ